MKKEELTKILELHRKWINDEDGGVKADLSNTDLRGADLHGANLRDAGLCSANLRVADLRNADLCDTNLRDANLSDADLRGANLCDANLSDADLRGANLCDANLRGTLLRGATVYLQCPEEGAFIGYKKARGHIVKIRILEDAKRSSATSRKCRCDKAEVLSITNLDGSDSGLDCINSDYDPNFEYKIGTIVSVDNFDDDRFNECSTGIHFFITRREAVEYHT